MNRKVHDQTVAVAEAMTKHGGSFARYLGQALFHADYFNVMKINRAFPLYWDKYLLMAMSDERIDTSYLEDVSESAATE